MLKRSPREEEKGTRPEQIAPKLFQADSFAMRVRELADELFKDERWAGMYSDIGKPARSPKIMTIALILQQHRNLSDRQMERTTRYDLEVKAALGLPVDHPGIPKTCFSEFRARLLEYGRECTAFNEFNRMLVAKGWLKEKESLIVDASHLEAAAAASNPQLLIRKATQAIVRQLQKERPNLYREISERIELRSDTKLGGGREYYLLPEAERNERFGQAVGEARMILEILKRKKLSPALKGSISMLSVILEERSTDEDEPIDPDDSPPDRITNHRDPQARWGAKGKDKFFHGYKRTILTNKDGFIANLGVDPGNAPDGALLESIVGDTEQLFGIKPEKVIGDAAYGSVANHRMLKKRDARLVTPLKPAPNPRSKFSRDRFQYDPLAKTLTCPAGQQTSQAFHSQDGQGMVYRFSETQCLFCKIRDDCTQGNFRSVKVLETVPEMKYPLDYTKTDGYKEDMKIRQAIEGKHSEIVRNHGGRRTRYLGIARVFAGEAIRCLVVNLKRFFKLESQLQLATA